MPAGSELDLIRSPALDRALRRWETLSSAEQLAWSGGDARESLLEAVLPELDRCGAARVLLLDEPWRHSTPTLERLVAALSEQLGYVVPQTHANNLTSRIEDHGGDYASHCIRGHKTRARLAFHSDRADMNCLFYVRGAEHGGRVSIVSYAETARRLAERSPSALRRLYGDFPFDLREERIFDSLRWYERPILWRDGSEVRGHYIRRFIADSQRHVDCPPLAADQVETLDALDDALDELRVSRSFQPRPGELVVINNYRVMHARDEFEDGGGDEEGRLAIRTWIAPFDSEPLPRFLLPIAGALEPGCYRGGVGRGSQYRSLLGKKLGAVPMRSLT